MTNEHSAFVSFLEKYLKKEGLFRFLINQKDFLNNITLVVWILGNLVCSAYLVFKEKGINAWFYALIIPVIVIIIYNFLLGIFLLIKAGKANLENVSPEQVKLIAWLNIVGLPIIIISILSIYLRSWNGLLLIPVLVIGLPIILVLLQLSKRRIIVVLEIVISLIKALPLSLVSLIKLVPILLILTLFSVFSEELWSVIGELSNKNYFFSFIIILSPIIVLAVIQINNEAIKILGDYPTKEDIVDEIEDISDFKKLFKKGYISVEEWEKWKKQLFWRNEKLIYDNVYPQLIKTIKHRYIFFLILLCLSLTIIFFAYFCLLFIILFSQAIVLSWSGSSFELINHTLNIIGYAWSYTIPNYYLIIGKISLLLALFIVATALVNIFTEDSFSREINKWIVDRSRSWLAVSVLFQCVNSPNYQILDYVTNNTKQGFVNVSIVVPTNLSDEDVRIVCMNLAEDLKKYKNLVIITAFEKNPDDRYRRGIPGRRWEYLNNKSIDILEFKPIHLEANQIHDKHFLGIEYLQKKRVMNIPSSWYGQESEDQKIGKLIWDLDVEKNLILHPYVIGNDNYRSIDIHLFCRLQTTGEYKSLLQEIVSLIEANTPNNNNLIATLCFRDTFDTLATISIIRTGKISTITYKDELMKQSRVEQVSDWIKSK